MYDRWQGFLVIDAGKIFRTHSVHINLWLCRHYSWLSRYLTCLTITTRPHGTGAGSSFILSTYIPFGYMVFRDVYSALRIYEYALHWKLTCIWFEQRRTIEITLCKTTSFFPLCTRYICQRVLRVAAVFPKYVCTRKPIKIVQGKRDDGKAWDRALIAGVSIYGVGKSTSIPLKLRALTLTLLRLVPLYSTDDDLNKAVLTWWWPKWIVFLILLPPSSLFFELMTVMISNRKVLWATQYDPRKIWGLPSAGFRSWYVLILFQQNLRMTEQDIPAPNQDQEEISASVPTTHAFWALKDWCDYTSQTWNIFSISS